MVDTTHIALKEITITAARIPEKASESAHLNRVVTHLEIERSPVRDLAGMLEYLADIDVRQRGPGGVQSDISIRGGTFDQTAVLVNGINFNDPQTGHFQMDIPIPLSMIQQMEILPGSDVKSLGANAFTGAINLVTSAPSRNKLHGSLSGGRHGFLETGLDAAARKGRWWGKSGITFSKSDGYRENTDFRTLNGFLQAGYRRSHLDLSLMAGGLKKAFGANSFYTVKFPDQYERTGSGFAALQGRYEGRVHVSQSLFYRIHTDEFSLFRSDPPSWYLTPNYHLSRIAGSKTDAWFTSALGKTAVGFEYRHESVWSNVLGDLTGTVRPVSGTGGAVYDHYGWRSHMSLSVEQHLVTGPFQWNGGMVLHRVQAKQNFLQVYPGLDISFSTARPWRTYLSINRAFRLPTFTELYYKSPTNRGNAGLLPETAWNAETGAEWRLNGYSARLLGFYRFATQSIDWVRSESETVWHTENLGRIRTWGFETGFSYTPLDSGSPRSGVERLDIGCRYYFQHHQVESYYSQYVLDYLKWKMTAGVTLKIGRPFRFTAFLVWQERNGTYTSFDENQNMVESDYKPFATLDIKLLHQFRWITLFAECTNIFNREYFDLGGVPQPGAWYKAGFDINLEGRN